PAGVSAESAELNIVDNHWNSSNVGVDDGPSPEFGFALRPNPARLGRFRVDLVLPTDTPASLALFDVAGRRVMTREVGSLGAGRHAVDVADGTALAPGVYLVRL